MVYLRAFGSEVNAHPVGRQCEQAAFISMPLGETICEFIPVDPPLLATPGWTGGLCESHTCSPQTGQVGLDFQFSASLGLYAILQECKF